jgi:hypothetical protein
LSGGRSPGVTRVPSGKITIGRPSAIAASAARIIRRSAAAPPLRSIGMTP